jgi:Fe-S cluster biosynthesis and repair protein YggX
LIIDYTNDLDVIIRFSSLCTTVGMNIIAGADQGQGAWRSWVKISTMSANEIREQMGKMMTLTPRQVT